MMAAGPEVATPAVAEQAEVTPAAEMVGSAVAKMDRAVMEPAAATLDPVVTVALAVREEPVETVDPAAQAAAVVLVETAEPAAQAVTVLVQEEPVVTVELEARVVTIAAAIIPAAARTRMDRIPGTNMIMTTTITTALAITRTMAVVPAPAIAE